MLNTLNAPRHLANKVDRQWAAEKAAPYIHRKMPVGLELPPGSGAVATVAALAALPRKSLQTLLSLLDQVDGAATIQGEAHIVSSD
mgnify:FL=1